MKCPPCCLLILGVRHTFTPFYSLILTIEPSTQGPTDILQSGTTHCSLIHCCLMPIVWDWRCQKYLLLVNAVSHSSPSTSEHHLQRSASSLSCRTDRGSTGYSLPIRGGSPSFIVCHSCIYILWKNNGLFSLLISENTFYWLFIISVNNFIELSFSLCQAMASGPHQIQEVTSSF